MHSVNSIHWRMSCYSKTSPMIFLKHFSSEVFPSFPTLQCRCCSVTSWWMTLVNLRPIICRSSCSSNACVLHLILFFCEWESHLTSQLEFKFQLQLCHMYKFDFHNSDNNKNNC